MPREEGFECGATIVEGRGTEVILVASQQVEDDEGRGLLRWRQDGLPRSVAGHRCLSQ